MAERKRYPSDLSDDEWIILELLIPAVRWGGRPADYARREIVNAILYVLRTGCQWRAIPHDLPPWQLVYAYFRTWRRTGTWAQIHETLRQQLRRKEGRHPQASAAILDSQSVKTTEKGDRAATMRARKLKAEKGTF
jgi:putative transposase